MPIFPGRGKDGAWRKGNTTRRFEHMKALRSTYLQNFWRRGPTNCRLDISLFQLRIQCVSISYVDHLFLVSFHNPCVTDSSCITVPGPGRRGCGRKEVREHILAFLYRLRPILRRPFSPLPSRMEHQSAVKDSSPLAGLERSPVAKRRKLTGRAFYESIGSPKMVLAPMVDQSEFV